MSIRLDKITTKTGDKGKALSNCGIKNKSDIWFDLIGTIDELNAAIGIAQENADVDKEFVTCVQNMLFDIGSDLYANTFKVTEKYVQYVESGCEKYKAAPVNSFVLPTEKTAYWHLARALTRRAERAFWKVYEENPPCWKFWQKKQTYNIYIGQFLNRLSDLFYAFSMFEYHGLSKKHCVMLWKPGILN